MIRIRNKWKELAISTKIFLIITTLSIGLIVTIYLILYFLLPPYYEKYKVESINDRLTVLAARSKRDDLEGLKQHLYKISQRENVGVLLRDSNGKVEYGNKELSYFCRILIILVTLMKTIKNCSFVYKRQ
ncbi:hypothetical protein Q5M85_15270 [Paraclostridium bifermentans]|nr:hypothetical protein [Paraclostridium bifermentans]